MVLSKDMSSCEDAEHGVPWEALMVSKLEWHIKWHWLIQNYHELVFISQCWTTLNGFSIWQESHSSFNLLLYKVNFEAIFLHTKLLSGHFQALDKEEMVKGCPLKPIFQLRQTVTSRKVWPWSLFFVTWISWMSCCESYYSGLFSAGLMNKSKLPLCVCTYKCHSLSIIFIQMK